MKTFTICFLGTYDRTYSRNQVLLKGLRELNISVFEVHVQLKQTVFYAKSHFGISQLLFRIVRKLSFLPVLIKSLPVIARCDVILIPYPGHLDVPLGYLVGKLFRKPVLFDPTYSLYQIITSDFRVSSANPWLAELIKLYEMIIFSLPHVVFADSRFQKQYYTNSLGLPPQKIKLLPYGADDTVYPYQGDQRIVANQFTVVYYGLFNPIHGVEHIVDAAKHCQSDKHIKFLFIGHGQTYPEMVEKAKTLGLKNVIFYPEVREKDALPYLSQADVFLGFFQNSPTVLRCIPNKVLQGLALGKAVITAGTPAIASVFKHKENIYTCSIADGKALSLAIDDLKRHPQLRSHIAKNGYRLYQKQFTPKAVAQTLINVINANFEFK